MADSPLDDSAETLKGSEKFPSTQVYRRKSLMTKDEKLKERRRALSVEKFASVDEAMTEVVEFLLGEDLFAFELDELNEVCPLVGVTWIPGSPPFVLGVINLRGQVVPMIDLKAFLGLPSGTVTVFNKALVFQRGQLIVGFLADEVIGVRKIGTSQMQYSVGMLCGATADYVHAVTTSRLVILSADKVLSDPRLSSKTSVSEA